MSSLVTFKAVPDLDFTLGLLELMGKSRASGSSAIDDETNRFQNWITTCHHLDHGNHPVSSADHPPQPLAQMSVLNTSDCLEPAH